MCEGIAYAISLSSFRGGPTFPGMFIGAAGGIALSHLPGLPMVAGAAIGLGAMTAGMLQLPMTAVLLTTLFFGTDGIKVIPLVIVAVDADLRIRIPASLAGYFPLIYGIEGRGFRELSPTFVKPSIRGPLLVRQLSG